MSAEITLKHARDMLRHLVWWLDCAAAAVGWSFLLLLALSGFSLLISGALIGGFFTHYVAHPSIFSPCRLRWVSSH